MLDGSGDPVDDISHLDSLLPLFLTLQDALTLVDGEYILGEVTDLQLAAFKEAAARVQSITLPAKPINNEALSDAIYMQIALLPGISNSPFLRSISTLTIEDTQRSLSYLHLFLSPSLCSLRVSGMADSNSVTLTSFLSTAGARQYQLTTLSLSDMALGTGLVKAIGYCKNLQQVSLLRIRDRISCVEEILSLPVMHTLILSCKLDVKLAAITADKSQLWRSIKYLSAAGNTDSLCQLLDSLPSPTNLCHFGITVMQEGNLGALGHGYTSVVAKNSDVTLQELVLETSTGNGNGGVCGSLSPDFLCNILTWCKQLRAITLHNMAMTATASQFSQLPHASALTKLHLPVNRLTDPVTNNELAAISKSCEALIDFRALLQLPTVSQFKDLHSLTTPPISFPHLRSLSVGSIPNLGAALPTFSVREMCSLVRDLLKVFPVLQEILAHPSFLEATWSDIGALVKLKNES